MKLLTLFIIIGIALVGYSLMLEPFTDIDLFMQKYTAMGPGQSDEFFAMRQELLSPKYRIQDIGLSIFLTSALLAVSLKLGKGTIKSPNGKLWLVSLGVALPLITVAGFVFDLIQGMYRYEFPHWADSLGIPLMGVPIQLGILFFWSMAHLGLVKNFNSKSLNTAISLKLNPWLIVVALITLLLVGLMLFEGAYWYAVPGAMWLYYYLSIGASRMASSAPNKSMDTKLAAKKAREWALRNTEKHEYEYPGSDSIYKAVDGIIDSGDSFEMDDLLFLLAFDNEDEIVLEKIEEEPSLAWNLSEAGLTHKCADARWQIGVLLGRLGGERAIEYLSRLCRDSDEYVRRRALLALRDHDRKITEKVAIDWLVSEHEYSRMVALDTLVYIESDYSSAAIEKLRDDQSEVVQTRLEKLREGA
ncbi:Uncharacterised protein [Halioglobus japonicus]|nr:Uncharacterised protein [Halioglobus japonicus]